MGRSCGSSPDVVHHIRSLGDIELLKSYLLLVWSEWNPLLPAGVPAMEIAIREDFFGTAMQRHREDLTERLDHILGLLDLGFEYPKQYERPMSEFDIRDMRIQYKQLNNVFLELDRSAMELLPEA